MFRALCLGFRSLLRVSGLGFRIQGVGIRGLEIEGSGNVQGIGFWGFRDSGD